MAKKKTSKSTEELKKENPIEEESYEVAELDDASFDDDWDDEADLGDEWGEVPSRGKSKSSSKSSKSKPVYVVEEHDVEDEAADFEDDFDEEAAETDTEQSSERFDVPEGPAEVFDVPEGPEEVFDVPEEPQESDDTAPDQVDVPIASAQEVDEIEEVDVDVVPSEPADQADSVDNQQQPTQEDEIDIQPPQQTAEPMQQADIDVAPLAAEQEESAAEAVEDVEIPPEEDTKSAEEREKEEAELEEYRSMMGETNAEMADVSEYRNYRRKTKTEPTSSKPKKSDFDLFANRYKVKTMNATVAATDPIIYFYNACLRYNGSILLFNVYQVLQDRFLGKMVPQLFTAVAEAGTKIDELNEANLLEQLKVCAEYPQYEFIISISTHCFVKPALLEKMLKNIPEEGVPNLVLAFDCAALQSIAQAAKTGLGVIRSRGLKVLLDNTERVSMDVLSELDYDYIRIDARYYEMDNPRAESYLRLLLGLAKEQGIGTIACFCDTEDMADYMLFMGVDAVQGNAISRPMRTVPNSVKAITLLPSMLEAPPEETPSEQ